MRYMLLIYGDEAAMRSAPTDSRYQDDARLCRLHRGHEEGRRRGWRASRLQPTPAATTVRVGDGKTKVLDGPYADTKEQLGGYYMIEAPDLDAAIAWAARCPGAGTGTVEVRPVWEMTM